VPAQSIRCEHVNLSYPGSAAQVLADIDLEFPAGSSTAIVRLNGAGKTTLVKLLARLYEPTSGRITVDGVDLRDLDPRSWQRRLAVIFQDFVRLELDAAANIGLGSPVGAVDDVAIGAAADWADARGILDRLPGGLRTPLSSRYPGGVDLSGGQWQRLALARAFFAVSRGASVLVLDEPTAHLDIRAEIAFFERFTKITRGLTTIVISHRFSTVRRADQIVVLEHGRVAEQATTASCWPGRAGTPSCLHCRRGASPGMARQAPWTCHSPGRHREQPACCPVPDITGAADRPAPADQGRYADAGWLCGRAGARPVRR
jgi:ATP-binding cassette subfamily B protein